MLYRKDSIIVYVVATCTHFYAASPLHVHSCCFPADSVGGAYRCICEHVCGSLRLLPQHKEDLREMAIQYYDLDYEC